MAGIAVHVHFEASTDFAVSNPPHQHKNDNDDQYYADDTDAAVSEAIAITAEAATEATKQKDEKDDNKNDSDE